MVSRCLLCDSDLDSGDVMATDEHVMGKWVSRRADNPLLRIAGVKRHYGTIRIRCCDRCNGGPMPEALDLGRLRQGVEGTATSLEVWVDDDDLVRRLDFRIEEPWDVPGSSWSVSTRFYDLGEPVSVEAPANAPEWVPPPDATK